MVIIASLFAIALVTVAVLGAQADRQQMEMEPVRVPVYSKNAYRAIVKR